MKKEFWNLKTSLKHFLLKLQCLGKFFHLQWWQEYDEENLSENNFSFSNPTHGIQCCDKFKKIRNKGFSDNWNKKVEIIYDKTIFFQHCNWSRKYFLISRSPFSYSISPFRRRFRISKFFFHQKLTFYQKTFRRPNFKTYYVTFFKFYRRAKK